MNKTRKKKKKKKSPFDLIIIHLLSVSSSSTPPPQPVFFPLGAGAICCGALLFIAHAVLHGSQRRDATRCAHINTIHLKLVLFFFFLHSAKKTRNLLSLLLRRSLSYILYTIYFQSFISKLIYPPRSLFVVLAGAGDNGGAARTARKCNVSSPVSCYGKRGETFFFSSLFLVNKRKRSPFLFSSSLLIQKENNCGKKEILSKSQVEK